MDLTNNDVISRNALVVIVQEMMETAKQFRMAKSENAAVRRLYRLCKLLFHYLRDGEESKELRKK